jgi:hypothetical protein
VTLDERSLRKVDNARHLVYTPNQSLLGDIIRNLDTSSGALPVTIRCYTADNGSDRVAIIDSIGQGLNKNGGNYLSASIPIGIGREGLIGAIL